MQLLIKLLVVVGFICLVVVGLNAFLTPEDPLVKSDVIVAISGGDTTARANEAIRLYQQGWAPRLVFSGAAKDPSSPSNAHVMFNQAVAAGVPEQAIQIDEFAQNTRENAAKSRRLITEGGASSIILVTSAYHQRRAYVAFRDTMGDSVTIVNRPASDSSWPRRWWWLNPYGWYLTLTETVKTIITITRN